MPKKITIASTPHFAHFGLLGLVFNTFKPKFWELVTVIGSSHFSLGDYITPDLFSQLLTLKERMGIESFVTYQ